MKLPTKFVVLFSILFLFVTPVLGESNFSPKKGIVIVSRVNFRSQPDLSGTVMTSLEKNTEVTIVEERGSWFRIQLNDSREGWVAKNFIKVSYSSSNSRGFGYHDLISFAKNFLMTNYRYGGTSPSGFDCSGFTQFVFAKFGYQIPHSSSGQMGIGTVVSKDNLQPADLLFFSTRRVNQVGHVGIYIGNNQFIHAASGYGAVRISSLNDQYYQCRYLGARRIVNCPVTTAQFVKDQPQSTHSVIKQSLNLQPQNPQPQISQSLDTQSLKPQSPTLLIEEPIKQFQIESVQPIEPQTFILQPKNVQPVETPTLNPQPQSVQPVDTQIINSDNN